MQLWMYEKVALVLVLTNFSGDQWDDSKDSPYNPAIVFIIIRFLTSLSYDIMFILYYKLSIAFENFGEHRKANKTNGRKKVKKGTFIGAFLAVLAKSSVYY